MLRWNVFNDRVACSNWDMTLLNQNVLGSYEVLDFHSQVPNLPDS